MSRIQVDFELPAYDVRPDTFAILNSPGSRDKPEKDVRIQHYGYLAFCRFVYDRIVEKDRDSQALPR